MAWGSSKKKLGTGEPSGMAGAAANRWWGVFSGWAGRLFGGGGWRLRGVEVEDELQALDFISNGCKID